MTDAGASERYRLPARLLHWLMAPAIPLQLWLGWAAERADTREAGARLLHLHYQLGLLLAALLVMRLAWRVAHGAPVAVPGEPHWRRRLAAATHWAIYAALLVLPASGYIIYVWRIEPMDVLGLFEVPRLFDSDGDLGAGYAMVWYLHYWTGWTLAALVALHVGAAAWHQWVLRDGLIGRRMR
jgi:cytochrome b561